MNNTDLTLPADGGFLNLRVGAIILKDGRFLMVKNDTAQYCYSVGGRMRFGETAEEAVLRETEEETGVKLEIDRLGFIHETFFYHDSPKHYGKPVQEISFYFYMKTPADFSPVCRSVALDGQAETLMWVSPEDEIRYYPAFFKTELLRPAPGIRHIVTDERIGLPRGVVRLAKHQTLWETEAQHTVTVLKRIFGDTASDIRHVGSTSIPAIMAKPIIDIAVAVKSFDDIQPLIPELEKNGFYYRPNCDIRNQMLFARGSFYDGTGDVQTHFIHVVEAGSREWTDYINFRDYMNTHPEDARAYEALKLRLANEAPLDGGRKQYLAGKQAFITEMLQKAEKWRKHEPTGEL